MTVALLEKPVNQIIDTPAPRFQIGQRVYAVWEDPENNESGQDAGIVIGIVFIWASPEEELEGLSHLEMGFSYVCRSAEPDESWVDTFHDSLLVAG